MNDGPPRPSKTNAIEVEVNQMKKINGLFSVVVHAPAFPAKIHGGTRTHARGRAMLFAPFIHKRAGEFWRDISHKY